MSGPSNIKMQKTGAEEVGNTHVRWPASDLERSKDQSSNLIDGTFSRLSYYSC